MEMNFPHDVPISASSTPISLRRLDMDILRVLAVAPVTAREQTPLAARSGRRGKAALMALFAGSGRADQVARGSFNPHFAVAIDRLGATEHQSETGVYHSASVNRKAARLLRSLAPNYTNQAF
ncbi:hypothetical protein [Blastomonas aquatica]|nr:hypothetical protein [Blastomonas aquatica]